MSALEQILKDPKYHDLLSVIKGARNGFVYGCKIRFPHALMMNFLFSSKTFTQKIEVIYNATLTHATNLAKFVSIYKIMMILQRRLREAISKSSASGDAASVGKFKGERGFDTFIAGLVGGWCVFSERTAINEQIVLYVVGRVISSFLPRMISSSSPQSTPVSDATPHSKLWSTVTEYLPTSLIPRSSLPPIDTKAANPSPIPPADAPFSIMAALSWGLVMYIYRHHGETLQPGMVNSMVYLYRDSDKWNSLKTLLWHNK